MHTRLAYLGGVIPFIIAFFPENNWAKTAFGMLGITCFVFAYIFQGKASIKKEITNNKRAAIKKQKPLEMSNVHLCILKVFRENDGELISIPLIQQYTNLETIIINPILDDLEKHKLIRATNLDEFNGGWQYQPTGKGKKIILKNT